MLRDTIAYGGQTILTVYHDNEELDLPKRRWREREKIGRYWLIFEECGGCPAQAPPENASWTEQELLSHTHPLCPCASHEFCAAMTRYRTSEKPSHIFLPGLKGFRIAPDQWEALCAFVKRHVGIDLLQVPMACGDTFVFHYVQLQYHETKEGSVLVDTVGFDRIDIHFKHGKAICTSKTQQFAPAERTSTEFVPEVDWDTFDIYAYVNHTLWFYAHDVSFFRSLNMVMEWGGDRSVPLKKSGYNARYSNTGNQEVLKVGGEKKNLRIEQEQQQSHLLLSVPKGKQDSLLIQKGEEHTVYAFANRMLNRNWDEVCFWDPYLLDAKGKAMLVDWMRLLRGSPAKNIYAIYYRKAADENTMTLAQAKQLLSADWPLSQQLRRNPRSLHLIGLNEYIHDRLLLCREGTRFTGLALGTSINSLDSNYFCIHPLTPLFSQTCWETFQQFISRHTAESEVL